MGSLVLDDVCFAYEDDFEKKQRRKKNLEIDPDKLILKHLNLTVNDGEFICLVGHSGCGKTTLLRMLAGLHVPTSGTTLIDGAPIDGPGMDRSVVFQNYALFPWMKVKANVEFGIKQASGELGRNLSKAQISEIASEFLAKVNMTKAADLYPYQLSGGMQQRVAIARALAMDTEMLLFDEPFGALDVKTRRELQILMQELWMSGDKKKTAVFVTHDIEEAILLADRVVFMTGGVFREEFRVETPRLRDPEEYIHTPKYLELRKKLLDLFYSAVENELDQADRERVYVGGTTL